VDYSEDLETAISADFKLSLSLVTMDSSKSADSLSSGLTTALSRGETTAILADADLKFSLVTDEYKMAIREIEKNNFEMEDDESPIIYLMKCVTEKEVSVGIEHMYYS
jgi:hypothetical protein